MFKIPLMQWLAGVLTDALKPAHAETPPSRQVPAVSPNAGSAEVAGCARDQVATAYRARISQLQHQRDQTIIQRRRCFAYLVVSLITAAVFLYLYSRPHPLPLWAAGLPSLAAFVALGQAQKCGRRARDSFALLDFYGSRLRRVQHEWIGKGDPGVDLQNPDHLSARDLDLFGEGSIFELLCDVGTPAGRDTLSQWLQNPCSPDEVISRQGAVRSLKDRTSLREQLVLARSGHAREYSWDRLCEWLVAAHVRFPHWAPWALLLLSLGMVIAAASGWQGVMGSHETLLVMALIGAPEAALALFLHGRVRSVLEGLLLSSRQLESLRELCSLFESERMESPPLVRMQQKLQGASEQISRLQRLVGKRELRDNEWLFWPLFLLAWKTQWTLQIERWRQRHGQNFVQSLTVLGELEALMAMATYAYENPADPYPELVAEGPLFEATGMGHPLLDVKSCVRNDLKLGGETSFLLVTGSNMSGKSTLLRAVGLNATLAWMGAPVRARHLRLSPLCVCASIRINDSLLSGRSHFYAEVERLKATLDCATKSTPVLFLIDELFAGTNSADRRIAAEAVIRLLVERRAIGMVTSHDLSLTEVPEKQELKGLNVHFAHLPTGEGLGFDYHLRAGKVMQSNALQIIRMIGIPIY
jgi:MutS domain V